MHPTARRKSWLNEGHTVPTDGAGAAKSVNENLGTFSFQRQLSGRLAACHPSLLHDAKIKTQGVAGANSRRKPPFLDTPVGGVEKSHAAAQIGL